MMEDATSVEKQIVLVISVAIVMLLTFIILYSSSRIIKFLGQTGINVMMRLMGLIVMVIAVEFFFAGIKPFIQQIIK
jgi:multiple antibiotic resistance protein